MSLRSFVRAWSMSGMGSRKRSQVLLPLVVAFAMAGLVGHLVLTAAFPALDRAVSACAAAAQLPSAVESGICALHAGFQTPTAVLFSLPLVLSLLPLVWPRLRAVPPPLVGLLRPPVQLPA